MLPKLVFCAHILGKLTYFIKYAKMIFDNYFCKSKHGNCHAGPRISWLELATLLLRDKKVEVYRAFKPP